MELLLEAGADALAVDQKRHTYLHFAAGFDLPRSIRALAARGVDVNIKVTCEVKLPCFSPEHRKYNMSEHFLSLRRL